jgi:hypothetical protein
LAICQLWHREISRLGTGIWLAAPTPPPITVLGGLLWPGQLTKKGGGMAALINPHWETISPSLHNALIKIGRFPFSHHFYLAGGTALSLQIGHRTSIDLDFFISSDEIADTLRNEIISTLTQAFPDTQVDAGLGGMVFTIHNHQVGFYSYSYRLLATTLTIENISLASIVDIALMKMDAIVGRGSRKDFVDLYFIAQQYQLENLLERGKDKYPFVKDFGMMVFTALVDFTNADQQSEIVTTPETTWESVKQFFRKEAHRITHSWFE